MHLSSKLAAGWAAAAMACGPDLGADDATGTTTQHGADAGADTSSPGSSTDATSVSSGSTSLPPADDTSANEGMTMGPDAEMWGAPEIVCMLQPNLGDATNPGSLVVLDGFAHIGSVIHGLASQHWVVDLGSGRVVAEPTIGGQLTVVGNSVFVAGWSSPPGANPNVMSLVEYAPEGVVLDTLLEVENGIIHPVRADGSALFYVIDDLGSAGPLELWSWDFETAGGSLVADLDGGWPVLVHDGTVWASYALADRTARFGWLSGRPASLVDIVDLPGLALAGASTADLLFVAPSYGSLYRIDPEERTLVEIAVLAAANPDVVADGRHVVAWRPQVAMKSSNAEIIAVAPSGDDFDIVATLDYEVRDLALTDQDLYVIAYGQELAPAWNALVRIPRPPE